MKRLLSTLALASAAAFLAPHTASAQGALSLEIRGDANKPIGNFANDGDGIQAESDLGFAADLMYQFGERFFVYGGYSRDKYGCGVCGAGDDLKTEGAEGGLLVQFFGIHPRMQPWLRAGAIYQQLDVNIYDPEVASENVTSDWNFGFQFAGGLNIPFTEYLSFVPAVQVQTYSVDLPELTNPSDVNPEDPTTNLTVGPSISQISLEIGGRLTLPLSGS